MRTCPVCEIYQIPEVPGVTTSCPGTCTGSIYTWSMNDSRMIYDVMAGLSGQKLGEVLDVMARR